MAGGADKNEPRSGAHPRASTQPTARDNMKRVTALIAALAVPAILLVGCGGDDSADSGSKSDSSSQSSDSGSSDSGSSSSTGNAKVDKFCDDAKALAEKSKKAIADRDTDLAQEAAKD